MTAVAPDVGAAGRGADHLVFEVSGECFALPVACVGEIGRPSPPTPVPHVPPYVRGVVNLRGTILAVVDLGLALGLAAEPVDPERWGARVVVVHHDGVDVALLVDAVLNVHSGGAPAPVVDGLAPAVRQFCTGTLRTAAGLVARLDPGLVLELRGRTGDGG